MELMLMALALGIGCVDWSGLDGSPQGGDAADEEHYYDQAPLELLTRDAVYVGEFYNGELAGSYLYDGDDYIYTNNGAYAYDVTFTLANPADMFGLTVLGVPVDEQSGIEDDGAEEAVATMPPLATSVTTTLQPGSTMVVRPDFVPATITPDDSGYTQVVESDVLVSAVPAKGQRVPDDYPYLKISDIAFIKAHLIDYCLTSMADTYYAEKCGLVDEPVAEEGAEETP